MTEMSVSQQPLINISKHLVVSVELTTAHVYVIQHSGELMHAA